MENVFMAFCIMLQQGFDVPPQACNSAFTATYINSDMKKEVDASQQFLTKKGWVIINEHRVLFYSLAAIGGGINVYKTQELHLKTPLTPYVNQLSIDWTSGEKKYYLNWQWNF